MTALSDALTAAQRSALAADDAAEAFRWGYGGDPARLEGDDE